MIALDHFADAVLLVAGCGLVGQSYAEAAHAGGATVLIYDDLDGVNPEVSARIDALVAARRAGRAPRADLHNILPKVDAILPAPGIKPGHTLLAYAARNAIPVYGEIDLLRLHAPEALMIGITGTNGKSTTTALLGHIIAGGHRPSACGGNLGVPMLSLPALGRGGIYILELSSFQLYTMQRSQLDISVWLNFAPDHLDWHGSISAYQNAKMNLFRSSATDSHHLWLRAGRKPLAGEPDLRWSANPQFSVIGVDDDISAALYETARERGLNVRPVSGQTALENAVSASDGILVNRLDSAQNGQNISCHDFDFLIGAHMLQNLAAAYTVAMLLGTGHDAFVSALKRFSALPHRLETVESIPELLCINDSKATSPHSAAQALQTFANIHWIAGGVAKAPLGTMPLANVRSAAFYGKAGPALADAYGAGCDCRVFTAFADAVRHAFLCAKNAVAEGRQTVLLSPACASFDQFRSFQQRGEQFRQIIQNLSAGNDQSQP